MRKPGAGAEGTKTSTACCSKIGLKRGPWTAEEDEVLCKYIEKEGEGRWRTLPKRAGLLRCGKSCRLRWMNYLRPSVKRGHIAPDEEDLILRLHRLLGNRWSLIAGRIPGRTDNEIKNYWNTHLSKKLISQGIDPRTHKPLVHPNPTPQSHATPSNPNPIIEEQDHALIPFNPPYFQYSSTTTTTTTPHANSAMPYSTSINNDDNNVLLINHQQLLVEDDADINYCSDDVFSSFLNSLINDDAFSPPNNMHPPS